MKRHKFPGSFGRIILSAAVIFFMFYRMLPAINLRSRSFIMFLISSIVVVLVVNFTYQVKEFVIGLSSHSFKLERDPETGRFRFGTRGYGSDTAAPGSVKSMIAPLKYGLLAMLVLILFTFIADIIGIPFFNALRYRDLIQIEAGDFSQDVSEIRMNQIPVVDRDTASRLGSRKLGEMSELVSQFEIENDYTQINYQGTPYRVTPLTYADPVKWFFNQKQGLPAYITVNMVSQQTELVWLEQGMKYSPSEYFFRNIHRHIRFLYPTKIFETVSFEIDDEGTPYWVAPTISYKIGWWSGKDISGAILVNAITGDAQYYTKENVPQWIDQLYDSSLIISQLDDNGLFQNGYINSIFGQKNVRRTTYGYNYLALDDDVFLYTGMSSVTADQSNIGFVLVNLRTKETRFYTMPGATEYSAMDSAEGQVQHLKYSATFPLLLNISDRPTYFVSLKDAAGLVKMYAFVDVEQYQIVGTGQTIDEARRNYRSALNLEDVETKTPVDIQEKSGIVDTISSAVVAGNTCYYFTLRESKDIYSADVLLSAGLPFMQSGSSIRFTCSADGNPFQVLEIQELKN